MKRKYFIWIKVEIFFRKSFLFSLTENFKKLETKERNKTVRKVKGFSGMCEPTNKTGVKDEIFSVVSCDRFKKKSQRKVEANRHIKKGETILQSTWFERSSFVATSKEEYMAKGGSESISITFTEEEAQVLQGGALIENCFTSFGSPGHLQLMMELIVKHGDLCQKWVGSKDFVINHHIPGMAVMSKMWHEKALKYLETVRLVPNIELTFWCDFKNFQILFGILTTNAFFLDLALSGSVIGVGFDPKLACFNHDCVPNAFLEKLPVGFRITAATSIKKGEEITISYVTEAVGLLTNEEIDTVLQYKFGFLCECPTHKGDRPLYLKKVVQPLSLQVLCHKNKGLAQDLDNLNDAYRAQDFILVRSLCYMIEKRWGDVIRENPRLAYAISSKYVNCIPNVSPDGQSDRWLQLYQNTLLRYCANPIYVLRSFFWFILETVRRFNIIEIDKKTGQIEHSFAGSHSKFVSVFLMSWLNLKRRLNFLLNSEALLSLEGCMFTGLTKYMKMMTPAFNSMIEFIESEDREAKEREEKQKEKSKPKNNNKKNQKPKKEKAQIQPKIQHNKKDNIVATTFVMEKERVCVDTPYQVTAIDDRALNLYYFGETEPKKPLPQEKLVDEDDYLNGILTPEEVDDLVRKNNPSFFVREKRGKNQSVSSVSESQRAVEKELMNNAVNHAVSKSQKKKKKKNDKLKKTKNQVKENKPKIEELGNKEEEEESDDANLFIPIQIDYSDDE